MYTLGLSIKQPKFFSRRWMFFKKRWRYPAHFTFNLMEFLWHIQVLIRWSVQRGAISIPVRALRNDLMIHFYKNDDFYSKMTIFIQKWRYKMWRSEIVISEPHHSEFRCYGMETVRFAFEWMNFVFKMMRFMLKTMILGRQEDQMEELSGLESDFRSVLYKTEDSSIENQDSSLEKCWFGATSYFISYMKRPDNNEVSKNDGLYQKRGTMHQKRGIFYQKRGIVH